MQALHKAGQYFATSAWPSKLIIDVAIVVGGEKRE